MAESVNILEDVACRERVQAVEEELIGDKQMKHVYRQPAEQKWKYDCVEHVDYLRFNDINIRI